MPWDTIVPIVALVGFVVVFAFLLPRLKGGG